MISNILIGCIIFIIAVTMTMAGKGGGNFYVLTLAFAGMPMHEAATTGQFILFTAAFAAMLVFQKRKAVAWPLALCIGVLTAISAFAGGYFSHVFSGFHLKLIFSFMLLIAGLIMLIPASFFSDERNERHFGTWNITLGGETYTVNLLIFIPISLLSGFGSGMVGVSGGSFLVPLMVLTCGVSMHIAVGTASILIAVSAFMGFTGHALQGDFNPLWAVPLALVTIIGGILGGKLTLKTKPDYLKRLFAFSTLAAAFLMILNAIKTV